MVTIQPKLIDMNYIIYINKNMTQFLNHGGLNPSIPTFPISHT
jgi:hypothetical protein